MKETYDPVSIRLDSITHEALEKYWRQNMYKNKSTAIIDAINMMVKGVRCPNCKTLCPTASHLCPVCFTPFDKEDEYGVTIQVLSKNKEKRESNSQ